MCEYSVFKNNQTQPRRHWWQIISNVECILGMWLGLVHRGNTSRVFFFPLLSTSAMLVILKQNSHISTLHMSSKWPFQWPSQTWVISLTRPLNRLVRCPQHEPLDLPGGLSHWPERALTGKLSSPHRTDGTRQVMCCSGCSFFAHLSPRHLKQHKWADWK